KHYILSKKLTTSLGNTTAVFSTNNLAKFNVSVSCITGYTFSKMTFNSETSTVNMNLNPGDAVYISPNTDYYFGSLNVYAYDKTIGRDYNYSFLNNSGNYDTSANAVNNINIQDFTVIKDDKFQYYQVSPGSITASYCIESENLTLDNITCNDYYQNTNGFNNLSSNGLYLNLYNSLGKLAASNKYTNNTTSTSGTINNCNLSSGNYNINVMIPQYTKTINSLDVNVTALYVQKVKVMNPFDTTKPLSNGNIHIYYDGVSTNYTLDSNGCAVVAKGTVINPTDIIVSADTSKGMVIYSPNTVPSENEIDITKSISEMKQYSIYPDNLLANSLTKINLANANMKLTNNDLTYSTNLDSTGKKTLYLDGGQYSAVIYGFQNLSNKYYITSTIDAVNNNQTIINTLNTAQITTDKKVNVKLNCDDSLINSIEGSLYVSPNVKIDYSYCDILNNLCYNGTYESTANDKKSLKFGQTITASALIKGTSFKPLDNVNYSISFKDEFNNNVTLSYDQNNYMSAIFTQNEKIAASLSFYVPDGSFTLPENLSGNIKLYFNLDIGRLGVIKTNEINITANADKYYKISVIDPQGNMSKGGTINLVNTTNGGSRTATYSITSSGLAFIKKSDVQYGTTYNLAINGTVKNTGETFICNKIFNSTITAYKADNCSNVTISTNFNTEVNCIGGNLSIISNGKKIYDSFVNFDANGNATIWLDKSKYDFQLIDSFDTSSYYLSADNIDLNTTSKVIFDGINLCKTHIETSFDKTIISDSSCKYKITAYGSCDVYLPYNLTFNYISTKNKLTYTGSFKTESGKVNNISAGNTIKLSGSLINNNVTNNESVAALLNLSDENNSKIDMGSNSIRTVITQNSEIIQTFYSYSSYYYDNGVKKKCYSFYIPDDMIKGTYQVQFFIDSNDTSDEIKSSIYNFTVNDNKYYNITVNDPSGKPSKGGKITIKNVDYNYDVTSVDIDSNGNANIDKNLFSFSDNCKMFITGYTNSTNELFESVKNFSINTKTYTPNASVKVNCSTIKPADKTIKDAYFGISYGNSLIYKNYIYSSTDIKNSISNYDNFNVYLEKGVFDFYMNLSCTDSSNTTSVYNMTADNIDTTKTDSVTFDSSNTSLVTPINDSGQPLKDFCLQYGWNDKFYTIDFNAITSSPKEYFTKNKLISVKAVNYTERTDDDFIYYKKNILISGDKTDIHYGKGQNTISNNLYFQNTIITGSIFKPNITKITTSDGYTITESSIALDSSTITLNISKDGVLIKSLSGTYGNGITITSSDISSGVYSVQVVISSPVIGQIKSNPTKVLIYNGIDDLCNFYNLSNAGQTVSSSGINIASGNAAIYDGSSKVYDFAKDNNKVLKTSLVSGKSYTISENYLDTSNILRLYTASFNYNEGYTSFYIQEPSTVRTVTITGLPNSIVKITKGTLASSSVLMNSKGTLTAKLDDGTYTITMKGYDASNKYCEVTKTIIVDSSSTSYNLNN
ncbi:MAG: hypothetical protein Q8900_08175, partial [Bacillota bacterium]|nr:hypothetical protein [Bacillota bacterium]